MISMHRDAHLMQVVGALHPSGRFARLLDGWE
jgi:hypothetical protein